MRWRHLELFCGGGGSAYGYWLAYQKAGIDAEIVGVDIADQPNFPFTFVRADALTFPLEGFDFIAASPPCQFYANLSGDGHWRSIPPTRDRLLESGQPFVIENIQDAGWDMRSPIRLCGSMFGLKVRRHRLFESSFPMLASPCAHWSQDEIRAYYGKKGWLVWSPGGAQVQKKGRKPLLRGSVEQAPEDMGIDWMTWDELREAVPPAFTSYVGEQFLAQVAVS